MIGYRDNWLKRYWLAETELAWDLSDLPKGDFDHPIRLSADWPPPSDLDFAIYAIKQNGGAERVEALKKIYGAERIDAALKSRQIVYKRKHKPSPEKDVADIERAVADLKGGVYEERLKDWLGAPPKPPRPPPPKAPSTPFWREQYDPIPPEVSFKCPICGVGFTWRTGTVFVMLNKRQTFFCPNGHELRFYRK